MKPRVLVIGMLVALAAACAFAAESAYKSFGEAYVAGQKEYKKKDYAGCAAVMAEALKLAQNDDQKAQAHAYIGYSGTVQKKHADARAAFQQILKLGKVKPATRAGAQLEIGLTHYRAKEYAKAREELGKVAAMEGVTPHQAGTALNYVATAWYDESKKERAIRGGCYSSVGRVLAKCTTRDSSAPDASRPTLGFRCARDA